MIEKITQSKGAAVTMLAFLLSVVLFLPQANAQLLNATTHRKFVNPLPIPSQIDVSKGIPLEMHMDQTVQWLGLEDPLTLAPLPTTVWGYGKLNQPVSFPGPTLIANKDVPVNVTWHNNLPGQHLLPVDPTLHMAGPHHQNGLPPTPEEVAAFYAAGNIPTVVHLHGGNSESASDGLPEAWYTQNFGMTGATFVKPDYTWHNTQEAATLWYHDHALGITRLNVYAGLAGFYLLQDKHERNLVKQGVLPKGSHDIEIVIQDRMFSPDGELFLPAKTGDPWFGDAFGAGGELLELPFSPSVVAEYFGDFIVVNGMVWPHLEVEPRQYRFRLLNGSDSRFYVLSFGERNVDQMGFLQIATDDGLLPYPVELDELVLAPGERAEVVVDFTGRENNFITMRNYGPDEPYKADPAQAAADPATTGQIMQFQVTKKLKIKKNKPADEILTKATKLREPLEDLGDAGTIRHLALFEGMDADDRLQPLLGVINGDYPKDATDLNGSLAWFEPITENPMVNDVEEWWVYNATEDAHPIHLHLVAFQIIDRQPFDAAAYGQPQIQHDGHSGVGGYLKASEIHNYTGPAEPPAPNELGWKDTFIVPPGYVGRVKARFNRPGRYVWHCHILSHEDHEMMRPFHVGPLPIAPATGLKSASAADPSSENEELDMLTDFRLYPNPVKDLATVEFFISGQADVRIQMYKMDGRLVKTVDLGSRIEGMHAHTLSIDELDNGMYILELKAGDRQFRETIFISK